MNDNQIIKYKYIEEYTAQTKTDTAVILTSVRFPGSFSVLNSHQTTGCPRDMSQAIDVVFEYLHCEMQASESMHLCAVSFKIILSIILINLVVKVLEDTILFV